MRLVNFHTHRKAGKGETAICNSIPSLGKENLSEPKVDGSITYYSVGLHPWHVSDLWQREMDGLSLALGRKDVVAVGECGLDRCCSVSMEIQLQAFEAQAELAEQLKMPVIIHCVRALDLLLGVRSRLRPDVPWVVHGFRGNERQMQQLLRAGIYVSFGARFVDSALQVCPRDSFFLETDDNAISLLEHYHAVALWRGETVEELIASQAENLFRLCGCR